jgi:hypothetical protein
MNQSADRRKPLRCRRSGAGPCPFAAPGIAKAAQRNQYHPGWINWNPERRYVLKPGDAHFYDVGVVHSPDRQGLTKLVRIQGANLDHTKRSSIKPV